MREIKNYISSIIIFSLLLGFLATTSADAVTDFSGDWSGQWISYDTDSGGLSVHLTQSGTTVGGTLTISNTECGTFSNLPITGNISGNIISIYANAICSMDGSYNSLRFTQGVLTNNKFSGVYTVYSDGEFYDNGSFTLTRSINYINASAGPNGTIIPSGNIAVSAGGNQTFTISPNEGYKIANVIVDGVSVGAKNSYTFFSVSANHTITATFKIKPKSMPWLQLLLE
jgi:hypothetical protein